MSILKYPNSQINSQVINNLSSAVLTGQNNNIGSFALSAQQFIANKTGVGQVVIDPSGSTFSGSLSAFTLSGGTAKVATQYITSNLFLNPRLSGTGEVFAAVPKTITASACVSTSYVFITPTSDWGVPGASGARFYVDTVTANAFNVNLISDSGSMTFNWLLVN